VAAEDVRRSARAVAMQRAVTSATAERSVEEIPAPGPARPARPAVLVRRAVPALGLFIAVRITGLLVLAFWSQANGKSAHTLLSGRWDSLWYERIAGHGYAFSLHTADGRHLSSMAFYPLLPWLEKGISAFSPLSAGDAGLVVGGLCSVGAALALYATGEYCFNRRVGVILVVLWAATPVSIVQSMAYSESLFTCLAAWALYCLVRDRWVTAGALACLAGLTRPVGLAVGAALVVALLGSVLRGEARADGRLKQRIAACVIAPLGAVGFILWVGWKNGGPFGYLDVQAAWGNGFDGGIAFSRFATSGIGWDGLWIPVLILLAGLIAWAHRLQLRQSLPVPLVVYSLLVTVLAVGASGYFGSKPRLLLPAFPLLIPPAVALARSRPRVVWTVLPLLVASSAVYGAFWLNGSGPP
jgi:hypothetical protein